jgi:cobalt/nickel transport system permease protein
VDIGIIDYFANSGKSFFHRASSIYKIIFVLFVLASIVITNDFILLLSVYFVLIALVILTGLPFLRIVSIAAYPAIFALLFALASWSGNWTRSGVIVFKALDAALTMVLLIVTTPYPSVFASINPFLPKIVVEGLFLTYRAIFILLELMENLIRALRIRGGFSPRAYIKNIANFASGIGLLLIRGFDLSERLYGVMRVRGYSGKIAEDERKELSQKDFIPIGIGVLIFAFSLGARFSNDSSKYGVYTLIFSLLLVFVSASYVHFYATRGAIWKS